VVCGPLGALFTRRLPRRAPGPPSPPPPTLAQVRALAAAAGLATSGRKDSQGICFLGKVKFGEFVREHLGAWPGPLVDAESGAPVGVHEGFWFYTVGQRGGIKLPGGPWCGGGEGGGVGVGGTARRAGLGRRAAARLCSIALPPPRRACARAPRPTAASPPPAPRCPPPTPLGTWWQRTCA
jgi:hypothetical protein